MHDSYLYESRLQDQLLFLYITTIQTRRAEPAFCCLLYTYLEDVTVLTARAQCRPVEVVNRTTYKVLEVDIDASSVLVSLSKQ